MRALTPLGLLAWATLLGCSNAPSSILLELTSDLDIPSETNTMVVRIRADGATLEERAYPLGVAPRDRWPQSLPILAGTTHPKSIEIAAELRIAVSGRPSVVVGFGQMNATFPANGTAAVSLPIARACVDLDGDGYGNGFGCVLPDCDDTRRDVPEPNFCPPPPPPDAGVLDAAPDGGPMDAGDEPDGGRHDGGVRPDSGRPTECAGDLCEEAEVCFMDQCLRRCMDNTDCGELHLGCIQRLGVCICRVPCRNQSDCGGFECLDGCCRI